MENQLVQHKNGQINIVLHDNRDNKHTPNARHSKNSIFAPIENEFSSFIGLEELKKTIKEIYAMILINEKRKQMGLTDTKQVLHMLFKGNPGTGKTTVARKLAKIYFDMNLLSKGHFIEAERADLVGEYIGQTAQKTRAIIQKAIGGILFIDEAYSLARGGEKDFGKEAIDTLVKHMEDHHNDFILILAGYPYEMNRFLLLNPGLRSRFPFILDFDDYTIDELMKITKQMLTLREYELTSEAYHKFKDYLYIRRNKDEINFSNARFVRNVIEQSIRRHAFRLINQENFSHHDLIKLTVKDLCFEEI